YGPMGISYYLLNLSNFIQFYSMNNLKVFLLTFLIWFMILICYYSLISAWYWSY
ncbi:NADH dehydrogenase subunit 5, partial (mitochondrion) [Homalodisca vitripennis]